MGQQFSGHGHDLKQLIRWIVLSEPYSLSSKLTPKNKNDDPSLGEKPLFSHFYLRQMRAEELYESLLVATEADKTKASYEQQEQRKAPGSSSSPSPSAPTKATTPPPSTARSRKR